MSKVRRFVVTAAGDFASVLSVLTDHLGLRMHSSVEVDRTWLDTPDGVLAQSDSVLEFHRPTDTDQAASLTWSRDSRALAHDGCVLSVIPSSGVDLPDTPVMARLVEIVDGSALHAGPTTRSHLAVLLRLDDEEKTTARVVLDSSQSVDGAALPLMLEIIPMRGYDEEADALQKLIRSRIALQPSRSSVLELARRGAGTSAFAGSAIGFDLQTSMSAAAGWRSVLRVLTGVMDARLDGAMSGEDPEDLHSFRVAVRRLRTMLQDGEDVLDAGARDRFRRDFRWVGDITTPTRDADVHLEEFPDYVGYLSADRASDLDPFIDVLRRHRERTRSAMITELRSDRFASFSADWHAFLDDDSRWNGDAGHDADRSVRKVASRRIDRAHRRLLEDGRAITKKSPPVVLHDLRKDAKRLRYLLECFGSLFEQDDVVRIVKSLRRLQEVLGEYQDTEVQAAELLALTDELLDRNTQASTYLAVGAVVEQVERRGKDARKRFDSTFGSYDKRSVNRAARRIASYGGKSR